MKISSYCLLLICLFLTACSATKGPLYAEGEIAGEIIGANMDSTIAKYTLASSIDEPISLKQHRQTLIQQIEGVPNPEELEHLVEQGSIDFASVVYARALLNQLNNRDWQ